MVPEDAKKLTPVSRADLKDQGNSRDCNEIIFKLALQFTLQSPQSLHCLPDIACILTRVQIHLGTRNAKCEYGMVRYGMIRYGTYGKAWCGKGCPGKVC